MSETALQPLYVSVKDAALLTGVSRATLFRWIGGGEVPSYKIGGRRLLKPSELDAYIATYRVHGEGHVETDPVPDGVGDPD